MSQTDFIELNDDVAIIGDEGWFDGRNGNTDYLKFTIDQYLIQDFKKHKSMDEKLEHWRKMSLESSLKIESKLQKALNKGYKTVYILTHFPAFIEATRHAGSIFEKFWLPYNINMFLGKVLTDLILDHNHKIVLLTGHTHEPKTIKINKNIICYVGHPGIDTFYYQFFEI